MLVREIMTQDVETVPPEMNLLEAARRMNLRDVGFLPVLDGNRVVGVITDRDIVLRGLGGGRSPLLTPVGEIMTPEAIYCLQDEVLTEAARIMEERQVRRLLVVDESRELVGLLSLDDLAAHMSSDRLLGTVVRNLSAAG